MTSLGGGRGGSRLFSNWEYGSGFAKDVKHVVSTDPKKILLFLKHVLGITISPYFWLLLYHRKYVTRIRIQ